MSLPQELHQAIESAYTVMVNHPQYILPTSSRRAIYSALSSTKAPGIDRVYVCLSLLTARHVLPIWQRIWPDDPLPNLALGRTEDLLLGTVDAQTIEAEAADAWNLLED